MILSALTEIADEPIERLMPRWYATDFIMQFAYKRPYWLIYAEKSCRHFIVLLFSAYIAMPLPFISPLMMPPARKIPWRAVASISRRWWRSFHTIPDIDAYRCCLWYWFHIFVGLLIVICFMVSHAYSARMYLPRDGKEMRSIDIPRHIRY